MPRQFKKSYFSSKQTEDPWRLFHSPQLFVACYLQRVSFCYCCVAVKSNLTDHQNGAQLLLKALPLLGQPTVDKITPAQAFQKLPQA